jgi:hypothetical protein
MFKRINQEQKPNPLKPTLKRRNLYVSNKMEIENVIKITPKERYISDIRNAHLTNWKNYEKTSIQHLSKDDKTRRQKIFIWLLK